MNFEAAEIVYDHSLFERDQKLGSLTENFFRLKATSLIVRVS